jgi:hypothetical protein
MSIEIPFKLGTRDSSPGCPIVPKPSEYLHISRATMRHRKLMALAQELGCSWQDVARFAIDTYLRQNPPKQV